MKHYRKRNVYITLAVILLVIAVLTYSFLFKCSFTIDIEHSMPDKPPIDLRISIDEKELDPKMFKHFMTPQNQAEDVFNYNGWIGWSGGTDLTLSKGFHTITIESKKANIKIRDRFFLWKPKQRSLIQYIDDKIIFEILRVPRVHA
ncbi:MAG: hypothetical protein N2484_08320 [Clostridia bacterium]|nr:hypothetical protein [Clostridia bacterium]